MPGQYWIDRGKRNRNDGGGRSPQPVRRPSPTISNIAPAKIIVDEILRERGETRQDLARAVGRAYSTVAGVLGGYQGGRETRRAIAEYVGVPVRVLWPEEDG